MSRRSTALPGGGLYQFMCDSCWMGFNHRSISWSDAESQARASGWYFEGRGMSARDYCGDCR